MAEQNVESFNLSWRWLLVNGIFIAIIAWAPVAILGANLPGILLGIALFAILFGWIVFGSAVRIHDAGIDYGLFHHLSWQEVLSARVRKIVGLPYLFVERENKSGWWLPLYLKGNRPMVESLADNAPDGSPVRQLLIDG